MNEIPTEDTSFWRKETTWAGIVKVLLETTTWATALVALFEAQSGHANPEQVMLLGTIALSTKLLASYATVAGNLLARLSTTRLANITLPMAEEQTKENPGG